jgi:hypothetical protein
MKRSGQARRGGRNFCNKVGYARWGNLKKSGLDPRRAFARRFGRSIMGHIGRISLHVLQKRQAFWPIHWPIFLDGPSLFGEADGLPEGVA